MSNVTDQFYANEGGVGYGAQLMVGQGDSPETFVAIPVMMKITPGAIKTAIADATHLRSPNAHREKKLTIRDSDPIGANGFYVPGHGAHRLVGGDGFDADHNLIALSRSRAENNFKIVYPGDFDDLEIGCVGGVSLYKPGEITLEGMIPFDLEITPLRDYFTGPE